MNDGEREEERERRGKRKKKREERRKSEAAVTRKRRGWKTGDSGREWIARAISGGRLTTSQLKEDTRAFFSVLDDARFVRASYLTLTLPERIFYRGSTFIFSTSNKQHRRKR